MPKKDDLIDKLCRKPRPKNFTTRELDLLMKKCDCEKRQGGRGSSIAFFIGRQDAFLLLMDRIPGMNYMTIRLKW